MNIVMNEYELDPTKYKAAHPPSDENLEKTFKKKDHNYMDVFTFGRKKKGNQCFNFVSMGFSLISA